MTKNSRYEINHFQAKVILTKQFAKAASTLNTPEYMTLLELRRNHPDYTFELREIRKKEGKKSKVKVLLHLGITMLPLSDDFLCPCFFQFANLAIQILALFLCQTAPGISINLTHCVSSCNQKAVLFPLRILFTHLTGFQPFSGSWNLSAKPVVFASPFCQFFMLLML